ncbi:MAG TPA: hypothetical protein VFW29_12015 [Solirubrobacteraceae bacterium]|nr:hypothetical protein [Solirubrobacteraceae bacterium]
MNVSTRLRVFVTVATTLLVLAASACLSLPVNGAGIGAASASAAEPNIKYKDENQQEYEHQLAAREIQAATFNKRIRSLHILTKNGEYFRYKYPKKGEPALAAQLTAKHIPVTILTPEEAKREASKAPVKHKIRYIVGGILIVVIVVVGGVLLWNRRRKRLEE